MFTSNAVMILSKIQYHQFQDFTSLSLPACCLATSPCSWTSPVTAAPVSVDWFAHPASQIPPIAKVFLLQTLSLIAVSPLPTLVITEPAPPRIVAYLP
jgi:hypothetical protein